MIKAKPLLSIICLAIVLAMANCDRSDSNVNRVTEKATHPDTVTTAQQDESAQQTQIQENISQADRNTRIESITISPSNPTKDATVSVSVQTNPAELPSGMEIQYILWLNAAIAQRGSESTFPLATFKKNDFFYVDALLMKDDREFYRKRSEMIKILNKSPEIKSVDFPEIKGPGTYNIKINAIDIDSDPLSYSLEGEMLPAGSSIDSAGMAKIPFSDKSPENIVFWVVVKDNDEGETKQELKFSFTKTKIQK